MWVETEVIPVTYLGNSWIFEVLTSGRWSTFQIHDVAADIFIEAIIRDQAYQRLESRTHALPIGFREVGAWGGTVGI